MTIRSLKKTISAHNYVNKLSTMLLNVPYMAAKFAKQEVDFQNHMDVTQYRASIEAVVWTNTQVASRLVDYCLLTQNLIDEPTRYSILDRLKQSAEFLISEGLMQKMEDEDCAVRKPACYICGRRAGWLRVKEHRICDRCMEEVVQIVFARATNTDEYECALSEESVEVLLDEINGMGKEHAALVSTFLNKMISGQKHMPAKVKQQIDRLSFEARQRSELL